MVPATAFVEGGAEVGQPVNYMVSLQWPPGTHVCGATLVAPGVALTAAHCVSALAGRRPEALIGALDTSEGLEGGAELLRGARRRPVMGMLAHPRFNSTTFEHDVGLVFLGGVDDAREYARLPLWSTRPGQRLQIIGWGGDASVSQPSQKLRAAAVTSISDDDCMEANFISGGMPSDVVCCGGTVLADACSGDSGGPLLDVLTGAQVGVVSNGAPCGSGSFAAGVYASTFANSAWIVEQANIGPLYGARPFRAAPWASALPPAFVASTSLGIWIFLMWRVRK